MRRFLPLSERFLINYVDDDHTQTLGFDYGASVITFIILHCATAFSMQSRAVCISTVCRLIEVFICRRLHFNNTHLHTVDMQTCTALHTKCCGAVLCVS